MNKLLIVFAFLSFAFFSANAHTTLENNGPSYGEQDQMEVVNVFVHISAVKKGKDGKRVAKITKVTMGKGKAAGNNGFKAKLRQKGNRIMFETIVMPKNVDRLIMPKGFILNDRISKALGSANKIVMSGGSTMVKQTEKNMLWFEIQ
ncbi:MAG: hypothetical protein AAFY71_02920 [Bacteroidota bacterium]